MGYLHGYDHPLDDTNVLREVMDEYSRAKRKHGEYTLDGSQINDLTRLAALMEEVGEVAETLTYDQKNGGKRTDTRKELIQVANVALTWASIL